MEHRTPPDHEEQLRRRETLVPAVAVTAVAAVAVVTAFMVKRAETNSPQQAILEPSRREQVAAVRPPPSEKAEVVVAPPLKRAPTDAMGGAAACRQCGVVEMVVAVYDRGKPAPRGYQMHVRMDDGSVRTVEQRGALAAGSRVMVEGKSLRPLAQPG
jgi:hypothetical protein